MFLETSCKSRADISRYSLILESLIFKNRLLYRRLSATEQLLNIALTQ